MKRKNLLDSFAIMTWVQDEPGAQTVEDLLVEANREREKLLLHEVNLAEVYYLSIRRVGEEQTRVLAAQLLTLPIQVISTTPQILWQAALLKAGYSLSLADAFAAATAIILDAIVVTGDPEFETIADLVGITWINGRRRRRPLRPRS
ncbi:MAG: type II toxin-antitoxin system VapC family toxin [Candidatus Binatia bacterium]